MYPYIIKPSKVIVTVDGVPHVCQRGTNEVRYNKLVEALRSGDEDTVQRFVDKGKLIEDTTLGRLKVKDGVVTLDHNGKDYPVHNTITKRLVRTLEQDGEIPEGLSHIVNFLDRLMDNPSSSSVQELYDFLDVCELPITPEGNFIAYKVVTNDYKDKYTQKHDNSVGTPVSMPRNMVDDNRNVTCSRGLHICSIEYVPAFHSQGDKIVAVEVNPKDVVSVPTDYNNSKARVCEYKVIADITEQVMGEGAGDKPKDFLKEENTVQLTLEKISNLLEQSLNVNNNQQEEK